MASPPKSLTLKRVRPPTRSQLERSLNRQCTSIVHFMGHSTGYNGKAFLTLEDARACSHLVDAIDLVDSLHSRIFLIVLSSCLSHNIAHTEFGNIAHSLVLRGVPYALVTQFSLPDDAALVLSTALYTYLLQGASIEEVVTSTRRSLEKPGKQSNAAWLAGIPVLYTGLRRPAPALELAAGKPVIQPDPEQLQKTTDFTALPRAVHFVGRSREIRQVLNALLSPHARSFVLLHGLGGAGKTATAQVVAERVGWHYQDRVLAISFETFASIDSGGQLRINKQFVDRFYNRLARFYAIDPAQYSSPIDLQQPILQQRAHLRSLLILDNIETLIDAQKRQHPTAKALASFIGRLKEGDGAILLTSRIIPPSDWGDCQVVYLSNLSEKDGADLFLALVPTERKHFAPLAECIALSQRVQGHPLSIQLLAGRFADDATGLTVFLEQIETELEMAKLQTPSSLEDPERQRTLYACMDYSVKRLTLAQRKVLDTASLFLTPFLPEFAAYILEDKEQTLIHLQHLVRLGLLTATIKTFPEGELILLELHSMLRWYLQLHFPAQDAMLRKRYGELFHWLAYQSYEYELGYDQSPMMLFLVRQSLPDFEAAFQYLPFIDRGTLAYYLAEPYKRLGQNQHALALYEQALEIVQKSEKKQMEAVIKESMAAILLKLGQPPEAMALYEQALSVKQDLGDVRGMAVTQALIADALAQLGRPLEAMKLYEQALQVKLELGEQKGVMAVQTAMANLLRDLGKLPQAVNLYEQALRTARELGVARGEAVILHEIANLLALQDEPQDALTLYEQSLKEAQELGDVPGVAVTQNALADVLVKLGKLQEALELYEQALQTKRELGDVRGVSMTQAAMANVLRKMDKPKEALILYEQSLSSTLWT